MAKNDHPRVLHPRFAPPIRPDIRCTGPTKWHQTLNISKLRSPRLPDRHPPEGLFNTSSTEEFLLSRTIRGGKLLASQEV